MKIVQEQIKREIQDCLKYFRMENAENQLYIAKTINELIGAWHHTKGPYYKKRPYKKGVRKYDNANHTEQ